MVVGGVAVPVAVAGDRGRHGGHEPRHLSGPLASATVSFGAWPTEPPVDRMNLPPGPPPNIHELIPYITTIKAGGTVNFIIAGFHQVAVYAPGTKPENINTSLQIPVPNVPPEVEVPPLIDDPTNRVYRGPAPTLTGLDRTEVVHFPKKGLYLVICAFLPHFEEGMWGWVRVV